MKKYILNVLFFLGCFFTGLFTFLLGLLGLLLLYPEHRKRVIEEKLVSTDDFFTDLNRRVFEYIVDAYFNRDDSHFDMNEFFTPDEVGRIVRMKHSRMRLTENGEAVLLDSIEALHNSLRKKKASSTVSLEGLEKLLMEKRNVNKTSSDEQK